MYSESFDVGGLFELEKHTTFLWKLLPPNHIYMSEDSFSNPTVAHRGDLLLDNMKNALHSHVFLCRMAKIGGIMHRFGH